MAELEGLNPCAFCEEVPQEIETENDEDNGGERARVVCECGACGRWSREFHDDEESAALEAADAWNAVMPS